MAGSGQQKRGEAAGRWRGSPRQTGEHSGEQSRASKCNTGENKGGVRTVTLRGGSGTLDRRSGHDKDAGRQRQNCGCVRKAPMSADQANQRGRGQTEGRPGLQVIRRSLPRQWTRWGLDGDRRMGARPCRAATELLRCTR
jgi:hypothetical protein